MTKKLLIQRGFVRSTIELPDGWSLPRKKKNSAVPKQRLGRIKITSLMAANPRARRRIKNKMRWRGPLPDGAIWEVDEGISSGRKLRLLDWHWTPENKSGFDGGAEAGGGGGGGGGDGGGGGGGCGCGGCGCGSDGCGCEGCSGAGDSCGASSADTGCAVGGCAGCAADTGCAAADAGCAASGCAASDACAGGDFGGGFGGGFGGDFGGYGDVGGGFGGFGDFGGPSGGFGDFGSPSDFGAPADFGTPGLDFGPPSEFGPEYGMPANASLVSGPPGSYSSMFGTPAAQSQSFSPTQSLSPVDMNALANLSETKGPTSYEQQAAAMSQHAIAAAQNFAPGTEFAAAHPTDIAVMGAIATLGTQQGPPASSAQVGPTYAPVVPQSVIDANAAPQDFSPQSFAGDFGQQGMPVGADVGQAAPGTSDFAAAPSGGGMDFGAAPFAQTAAADFGAPSLADLSPLGGGDYGAAPNDFGQQYAGLDTGTMTDLPSTPMGGEPGGEKTYGPGSQLYAAATGEGTMPTSQEEERRAEQETKGGESAITLPEVKVSAEGEKEMPVTGGEEGEGKEAAAPKETTVSGEPVEPTAAAGAAGEPAPSETEKPLSTAVQDYVAQQVAEPGRGGPSEQQVALTDPLSGLPMAAPRESLVSPDTERTFADYVNPFVSPAEAGKYTQQVVQSERQFVERNGPITLDNPMLTTYEPGKGGIAGGRNDALGQLAKTYDSVISGQNTYMAVAGRTDQMGRTGIVEFPDGGRIPFIQTDKLDTQLPGHIDIPIKGGETDQAVKEWVGNARVEWDAEPNRTLVNDQRPSGPAPDAARAFAANTGQAPPEQQAINTTAGFTPNIGTPNASVVAVPQPGDRAPATNSPLQTIAAMIFGNDSRVDRYGNFVAAQQPSTGREGFQGTATILTPNGPVQVPVASGGAGRGDFPASIAPLDLMQRVGGPAANSNLPAAYDPIARVGGMNAGRGGDRYIADPTARGEDRFSMEWHSIPRGSMERTQGCLGVQAQDWPTARTALIDTVRGNPDQQIYQVVDRAGNVTVGTIADLSQRFGIDQQIAGLPWGIGGSRTHEDTQTPYEPPAVAAPQEALPTTGYTGAPYVSPSALAGYVGTGGQLEFGPSPAAFTSAAPDLGPVGGMAQEFNPFANAPNIYGEAIGPAFAGYEPFATEGYPFTNEPFATEADYPVEDYGRILQAGEEGPATGGLPLGTNNAAILQPGQGFDPGRTVFTNEPFATSATYPVTGPPLDLGQYMTQTQPQLSGEQIYGKPIGPQEPTPGAPLDLTQFLSNLTPLPGEPLDLTAPFPGRGGPGEPLDITPQGAEPLPQEGYEGFQAGNIQYPEAIGPRAEDFIPELNIPPSSGQPPAQTYEQTALGEITGEPFATGEGVEYPSEERPSVAGATDAETEERVAQSAETANVVMGRAADKVYENPLATRGDKIAAFNLGARNLEKATRGDPARPTAQDSPRTADAMRDYFLHLSDREKIAYLDAIGRGGREAQDATRAMMHAALGSEYFIGSRAAYAEQKGYLGPEKYSQIAEQGRGLLEDVHARSEANLGQTAWGATDFGRMLAAQRGAEPSAPVPPENIPQAAPSEPSVVPMSPLGTFQIASPEQPGDYPPMTVYSGGFPPSGGPAFPPGVHEIPGGVIPPSISPPASQAPFHTGPSPFSPVPPSAPSVPGLASSQPSISGLAQQAPVDISYFGGPPQQLAVSANSMARAFPAIALLATSLLSTQPAAVARIAAMYGVDSTTAAIILAQQQSGVSQMQEGGRVDAPQDDGIPAGFTWDASGTKLVPQEIAAADALQRVVPTAPIPGRPGWLTIGHDVPSHSELAGTRFNPDAFERWLAGLPESENVIDERTDLSDPTNVTSARFREVEEINREADRIRAQREKREREEKHSKR